MEMDQLHGAGAGSGDGSSAGAGVGGTDGVKAAGTKERRRGVTGTSGARRAGRGEAVGREAIGGGAVGGGAAAGGGAAGDVRPGRKAAGRRVTAEAPAPLRLVEQAVVEPRNDVALRGRVSGEPQVRELPSGDALVSWRLVVDRPPGARRPPAGVRPTTVDTLDCVAWTAGLRRTARALVDGDVIEVSGALRRRFWRAGAGAVSRCEVEVSALTRLSRRRPAR